MSPSTHPSDDDLERYLMGQTQDEDELARLEEHLIGCPACVERAEAMTDYIAAVKAALPQVQVDDSHGVQ